MYSKPISCYLSKVLDKSALIDISEKEEKQ